MIVLYTTEREYPYGTLRSTNASKVKVVLEEKGLPYRVERLRPGDLWKKPPEMLAKHPLGKVPYIEDNGLVVYDSTVINEYLEERYPHPPLLPKDPIARARARMLENFGDEAILVGDLPLVWMPWWSKPEERDLARMEKGREGLRTRSFPHLEKELEGREYLCDTFTLADVPYMALAMVLEVDRMPLDAFPRLAAYLDRLRARPSYRSISPSTSLADSAGREA
ncbi:MAG: glutathione S-transferase family protein [Thermodesulfobacteriota bacterium]|jgi:glutathione S-transferase